MPSIPSFEKPNEHADADAPRVYVIHENPVWLPPFAAAFDRVGLPWSEWDLSTLRTFDLSSPPPPGVWYNRMSASSHTRDHRYAAELTVSVLAWLTRHGRRVVNGPGAIDLEISKTRQYAALEKAGLRVPRTVLVQHIEDPAPVIAAAEAFFPGQPFILKPNRGGKGFGVHLMSGVAALRAFLASPSAREEAPVDGLWLVQEYIKAERPVITRAEFIGGRFLYAVEVDTSAGFLLCPADECQTAVGDALCPATPEAAPAPSVLPPAPRFTVLEKAIEPELIAALEGFLAATGVDVAGVEFIRDASGQPYVYDVNSNTNYNPAAESRAGIADTDRSGPGALAQYLSAELKKAAQQL